MSTESLKRIFKWIPGIICACFPFGLTRSATESECTKSSSGDSSENVAESVESYTMQFWMEQ